ncbi:TetR/AcrR family transcriptional regulator [Bifidobacterium apri]|uniref:TetR/AcrR family transcriptional regulator n=1 Tax=Bifidobacterium apri TaxID=1769423 RepID=UPI0039939589
MTHTGRTTGADKEPYDKESYVERQLVTTLIELLTDKPLDDIRINELCTKAGIGRASFYRHFQSKEEILERHARFLIKTWTHEFESDPDSQPWTVFESLFCHMKKHQAFYEVLHATGRDNVLRTSLREKIGLTQELANEEAYRKAFFADGISGWIEEWIERGMPETPGELNESLRRYVDDVLSNLNQLFVRP